MIANLAMLYRYRITSSNEGMDAPLQDSSLVIRRVQDPLILHLRIFWCRAPPHDVIVSLYGGKCLHLIRLLYTHTNTLEWKYIGAIAAVAIGQDSILEYQSAGLSGADPNKISIWRLR